MTAWNCFWHATHCLSYSVWLNVHVKRIGTLWVSRTKTYSDAVWWAHSFGWNAKYTKYVTLSAVLFYTQENVTMAGTCTLYRWHMNTMSTCIVMAPKRWQEYLGDAQSSGVIHWQKTCRTLRWRGQLMKRLLMQCAKAVLRNASSEHVEGLSSRLRSCNFRNDKAVESH